MPHASHHHHHHSHQHTPASEGAQQESTPSQLGVHIHITLRALVLQGNVPALMVSMCRSSPNHCQGRDCVQSWFGRPGPACRLVSMHEEQCMHLLHRFGRQAVTSALCMSGGSPASHRRHSVHAFSVHACKCRRWTGCWSGCSCTSSLCPTGTAAPRARAHERMPPMHHMLACGQTLTQHGVYTQVVDRMLERLQLYQQFAPYWHSRPPEPVHEHCQEWWRHAGSATISECQKLSRRQASGLLFLLLQLTPTAATKWRSDSL